MGAKLRALPPGPRKTEEGWVLKDELDDWGQAMTLFGIALVLAAAAVVVYAPSRRESWLSVVIGASAAVFMLPRVAGFVGPTAARLWLALRFSPARIVFSDWPLRPGRPLEVVYRRRASAGRPGLTIRGTLVCDQSNGDERHAVWTRVFSQRLDPRAYAPGLSRDYEARWTLAVPGEAAPLCGAAGAAWALEVVLEPEGMEAITTTLPLASSAEPSGERS